MVHAVDPLDAFTTNLRAAREAAGLTQEELANAIGTTQAYYSKVEGGHHDPSVRTVAKIAVGLGVTAADLMRNV
jgi:transcriptional regulator with XRE-family HTH domain